MRTWIAVLLLLAPVALAGADEITVSGHPRVVDADTLAFGKERVRIEGVDAPEKRQTCENASGQVYGCGVLATAALVVRIGADSVTCKGAGRDKYKRLIGFCFFADGTDLNGWLVRHGHAMAYRKYSTVYVEQESAARADGVGIWRGRFVKPWNWRRGRRLKQEPEHKI